MTIFVFFSSRRRHTRYWRDWSSDVCSSDLDPTLLRAADDPTLANDPEGESRFECVGYVLPRTKITVVGNLTCLGLLLLSLRSEERRVGKECRSRWSPYH